MTEDTVLHRIFAAYMPADVKDRDRVMLTFDTSGLSETDLVLSVAIGLRRMQPPKYFCRRVVFNWFGDSRAADLDQNIAATRAFLMGRKGKRTTYDWSSVWELQREGLPPIEAALSVAEALARLAAGDYQGGNPQRPPSFYSHHLLEKMEAYLVRTLRPHLGDGWRLPVFAGGMLDLAIVEKAIQLPREPCDTEPDFISYAQAVAADGGPVKYSMLHCIDKYKLRQAAEKELPLVPSTPARAGLYIDCLAAAYLRRLA